MEMTKERQKKNDKDKQGQLASETVAANKLSPEQIQEMWDLFSQYYESIQFEAFRKDLSEKNHVFLLYDQADKKMRGFSTVKICRKKQGGKNFMAIFSGDTIVDRRYWGQTALHKAFYKYVLLTKLKNPLKPVYWFLISKGYKTYNLLARNFVHYWPRYDEETPAPVQEKIHLLAHEHFGSSWKPQLGVLQFEKCPGRLKAEVAPISDKMFKYPEIRFFAEKNPGHEKGDELCCLGLINISLFASYALKLLKKSLTWSKKRELQWRAY